MRIENDIKLDFKDVLFRPKRSVLTSRSEVKLEREFTFRNSKRSYVGIPIIAANMDGVGTFTMTDVLANQGLFTCLVKNYSVLDLQEWIFTIGYRINDRWAYSLGISDSDMKKFDSVYDLTRDPDNVNRAIKYVCIDVANGYTERFISFVRKMRDQYPDLVIIAGNVVTGDITEELIIAGADIIKVGIGPGSVCTTRIKTGVGYPQLSAIIECADAAHGLGGHIIADGGCVSPGDVAKAFGAGADFVMLGGMLAGHDEGGGEVITKHYKTGEVILHQTDHSDSYEMQQLYDTKKFVKFYGMSSKAANDKHSGGLKDYRSSEGREVMIPYKGPVLNTVQDILGGLRSTCTYVGASELKSLSKCTTFIRVTQQYNNVFERN